MKSSETAAAKVNKNHKILIIKIIITVDLQKCLGTPLITNSISCGKLWTFNYVIYDTVQINLHYVLSGMNLWQAKEAMSWHWDYWIIKMG